MSKNIHPSPAIVTRADTSVREVVSLMKKNNVGSVLVVSDDTVQKLIGIFTERDLLKNFELLQSGGFWKKPVRTVMSQPVRVLLAAQLDRAADIMMKYNFRHLPVVATDEKLRYRLLGVISMRDLFVRYYENEAEKTGKKKVRKAATIGIVSTDSYFTDFLRKNVPASYNFDLKPISLKEAVETSAAGALILDLDLIKTEAWLDALKRLNKRAIPIFTVVTFTPALLSDSTIRILEKISASKHFEVFEKPVSIPAVLNALKTALS